MKKAIALLVLLLSVESFACAVYVCRPYGQKVGGWRIDLAKGFVCGNHYGDPYHEKYCDAANNNRMPIVDNRNGTTDFGGKAHSYFEVITEKRTHFFDARIYGDMQTCSDGNAAYPADLTASYHPALFAKEPGTVIAKGDPVCYGVAK